MAMAPPRPCSHPTCATLNCTKHLVAAWRTRSGPPPPRIRGRALQAMRVRLFAARRWCVHCLMKGLHTKASIRDHIVPLAEGGRDDATNEQGLCQPCSDRKTHQESARGVRRG